MKNWTSDNNGGSTPLHLAAMSRDRRKVETLLAEGADPNAANDRGETPLHWAAQAGSVDIVTALLNAGADPMRQDDVGYTPERTARTGGHNEAAEVLRRGADLLQNIGPTGRGC